jgi:hypothetical protein
MAATNAFKRNPRFAPPQHKLSKLLLLLLLFLSSDKVLICTPSWLGTYYVAHASLELSILQPQIPECTTMPSSC